MCLPPSGNSVPSNSLVVVTVATAICLPVGEHVLVLDGPALEPLIYLVIRERAGDDCATMRRLISGQQIETDARACEHTSGE